MRKKKSKTIIVESYDHGIPIEPTLLLKLFQASMAPGFTVDTANLWISRMIHIADGDSDALGDTDYSLIITGDGS